jgi:hypothetical protein
MNYFKRCKKYRDLSLYLSGKSSNNTKKYRFKFIPTTTFAHTPWTIYRTMKDKSGKFSENGVLERCFGGTKI